jgi:hypothetical protein
MRPGSVCRHLKIAGRAIISRFFHVTSQQPESCNTSTTSTYYIKTAAADTQAAMAKLETEILGNKWAMDVVPPQTAMVQ